MLYHDWTILWFHTTFPPLTALLYSDWITCCLSHCNWIISLLNSLFSILTGSSVLPLMSVPQYISNCCTYTLYPQVSLCSASAVSHMLFPVKTSASLTQNVTMPTYFCDLPHLLTFLYLTGIKNAFMLSTFYKYLIKEIVRVRTFTIISKDQPHYTFIMTKKWTFWAHWISCEVQTHLWSVNETRVVTKLISFSFTLLITTIWTS